MPLALAVDDEIVARIVLTRMLTSLGFEVIEADDVPAAREQLASHHFDLVVSDYQMPSGTGLDLLADLQDHLAPAPFVLLTGVGGEDNLDDDRVGSVDAHLVKPVSSAELAQVVDGLMAREPVPGE